MITRPVMRYLGGKFRIRNWVIQHLPPHEQYCEPFGGAGSVLLSKTRARSEIYNDLDTEIVNVFRVLRDPAQARELQRLLSLTPYAREELRLSYEQTSDPVELARRTIVRAFFGIGSDSVTRGYTTGFRRESTNVQRCAAIEWGGYAEQIEYFTRRLQSVTIENSPADQLIAELDNPRILFYLDPPYLVSTRETYGGKNGYRHELTESDHLKLIQQLKDVQGMCVISGYRSTIYKVMLHDWHRIEKAARADRAGERIECLWLNEQAMKAQRQQSIF